MGVFVVSPLSLSINGITARRPILPRGILIQRIASLLLPFRRHICMFLNAPYRHGATISIDLPRYDSRRPHHFYALRFLPSDVANPVVKKQSVRAGVGRLKCRFPVKIKKKSTMTTILSSISTTQQQVEEEGKTKMGKAAEKQQPKVEEERNPARVSGAGFNLVGYANFVRTNPQSDRFPVRRFHHVEFWTSDATNTARRFSWGLGMPLVAKSDLSTGNLTHASYLLRSGQLRFLFSAPYSPSLSTLLSPQNHEPATAPVIPSISIPAVNRFVDSHGLAVRAVAIEVADAVAAFDISVAHGALPALPPANLGSGCWLSEVRLYGDVVLRYVSSDGSNLDLDSEFLPGFEAVSESYPLDFGIRRLDHAVGNVERLAEAVEYVKGFTGFHEFAEFTAADVGTAESGLNSVVLASNDEMVLLPMNEPVFGTKRKSQIQTYLEHNEGPGLQHLALVSEDIFRTLREMRQRSWVGGFEFMPSPPPTYYLNLKNRAGDVLTEEQIKECEKLGILVDRDDQGVLLQIFTKPIGDRPTIFIEIIQRIGCMVKDGDGKTYQKGGCGGFGKGNFSELFKSIEEYEKTLEAKINVEQATA